MHYNTGYDCLATTSEMQEWKKLEGQKNCVYKVI
jgi:hypothetical protein